MTHCLFEGVVPLDYMVYFNFFGCVLVPLVIMLVIYIHIFMAARRQLRMMSLKVAHVPAPGQKTPSSGSSRSILQKEVHAAKSLAIIVGLFALCWLPVHIINCINHICQDCERPHIWVMNIAIILSHANSVVNPFIYAYRLREFRHTFRKILYQHILGKRDGHVFGVESADGRGVRSTSIMQTSARTSKEDLSCGTMVNSYVLDSGAEKTTSNASHEILDSVPNSNTPNGHQKATGTPSEVQHQPGILASSAQEAATSATNLGRATDILELKDRGSCITFVNVQAFPLKQNDCSLSSKITEISWQRHLVISNILLLEHTECSANVKFQQISLDSKSVFFNVKFYFFSFEFLFLMCTLTFKYNILFVMCRFLLSVLFVCHQN